MSRKRHSIVVSVAVPSAAALVYRRSGILPSAVGHATARALDTVPESVWEEAAAAVATEHVEAARRCDAARARRQAARR